jgi:hypothetical protein
MILRTTGCGTRHHPQAISSARWTNGSRPGTVGRLPEAVHCHELLTRISPPLGQFAGTGIGLRRLDRTEPFGREQRQAAGQLQFDLPPLPSRTLGECREPCKTTLAMAYRL